MVRIDLAYDSPQTMSHVARSGTGEAIEATPDQVTQRVARRRVHCQQADIGEHQDASGSDIQAAIEIEGADRIHPQKDEDDNRQVQKEAMQVVENPGEPAFAVVLLAEGWFANSTGRRVPKVGPVICLSVVVAGSTKGQWYPGNQEC